jgi:hypothetical protein
VDEICAEPVACTLGPADLRAQAARWSDLLRRAQLERTETADGLCLTFRAGPGIAGELRGLVAVETECCRWASWVVDERDAVVVLTARSAGDGVAALHAMFTGG